MTSAATVERRPIFIIGAPRSGTSLLYYLVAAHPELAYPDIGTERMLGKLWIRLLDRCGAGILASGSVHARFLPRLGETRFEPGLRFLGLDPVLPREGDFLWADIAERLGLAVDALRAAHLREKPALAAALRRRYESLLSRTARSRFVDKAPTYTVMLETLAELFPQAHIVHIIRDGRAVANSVVYGFKFRGRTGKWWGPRPPDWQPFEGAGHVERACQQWCQLVREGRKGRELFAGRYQELRYEALVGRTRATMKELYAALGLSGFGEDLFPESLESRDYKWQQPDAESFGDSIWTDRAALAPEDYGHLEVMRGLLQSLGYVEPGAPLAPRAS